MSMNANVLMLSAIFTASPVAVHTPHATDLVQDQVEALYDEGEYCTAGLNVLALQAGDALPLACVPTYGATAPVSRYVCRVVVDRAAWDAWNVIAKGWDGCVPIALDATP